MLRKISCSILDTLASLVSPVVAQWLSLSYPRLAVEADFQNRLGCIVSVTYRPP